jgi:asparagine synthase (glutamine-hydrolysing)
MLNFYINEHPVVGTGNSIFNNIKQILPGHTAKLSSLKKLVQKRWWNIKDHVNRENYPTDFNEQSEYFYELFKDACKLRLVSDVPVGTALSGGLDSSSVYSTVFSLLSANKLDRTHINSQNAFVATFPGLISDERLFAEEALQYTNGPAVFLEQNLNVSPENVISDTLKFDAISNAPITSVTNIYKGMKENGITVSLDGHAVDEMLYGYRNMMYKAYAHFLRNNRILEANNIKKSILPTYHYTQNELPINVINQINKSVNSRWGKLKYMLRNNLQKKSAESCLVHPELLNLGDPYDFGDIEFVDRIAYHETFINTLPVILRDFDRAGMMQGVEIRMPFMDWRIVSFLFSLPLEAKIANGYNKYILREAMRGRMAETIRLRRFKIGIGSPIGNWINGSLKEWALDSTQPILKSKDALTVKSADLKRIIENLQKGELNDSESQRLWLELNTQMLL